MEKKLNKQQRYFLKNMNAIIVFILLSILFLLNIYNSYAITKTDGVESHLYSETKSSDKDSATFISSNDYTDDIIESKLNEKVMLGIDVVTFSVILILIVIIFIFAIYVLKMSVSPLVLYNKLGYRNKDHLNFILSFLLQLLLCYFIALISYKIFMTSNIMPLPRLLVTIVFEIFQNVITLPFYNIAFLCIGSLINLFILYKTIKI